MFPYIVADIGATNARFGLVTGINSATADYELCELQLFATATFDCFESCLAAYLACVDSTPPVSACIAIAGFINGDRVQMTNQNWKFSVSDLRQRFGLKRMEVVNDFAALAYSTLYVKAGDLTVIHAGISVPETPRAVIGPGTGLGVAALVPTAVGWRPVAGEGGHAAFAPPKGKGAQILEIIHQDEEHVSAETLLSGAGLVRLHRAMAVVEGRAPASLSPEQITTRGVTGSDSTCRETLELFCHLLGSTAGDVTLIYGATGGVFLGGGILPRIENILLESTFIDGFRSKGLMSDYLANIPIHLMKGNHPALLGAAAWFYDQELGART